MTDQKEHEKDAKEDTLLRHNPPVLDSVGKECNELKHAYDACFNAWFSDKFLKGDFDTTPCEALLKTYTECVKEAMKKKNINTDVPDASTVYELKCKKNVSS